MEETQFAVDANKYSLGRGEFIMAAMFSICYRGHWFWVDDRDLHTKRYFQFMLGFLAQADTGTKDALPLVTIRAN